MKSPMLSSRSEEHTSELQSHSELVCRLLLDKKNKTTCSNRARWLVLRNGSFDREVSSLGDRLFHFLFARCVFFNDTATTEIYTLSLHDALPISAPSVAAPARQRACCATTMMPAR